MIGKSSSKKLLDMNINTIGELANVSIEELTKRFKSMGKMMHEFANGIDNSPVHYEKEVAKSISASTVLPYNYKDEKKIKEVIMELSMDIGKKIRDNKMYADTVGIWVKYNYFEKISKQKKLDYSISNDEEIYNDAYRIFDKLWNKEDGIRSICVFVSGLSNTKKKQLTLFDIENDGVQKKEDDDKLQGVLDNIRNKYGNDIIKYGSNR